MSFPGSVLLSGNDVLVTTASKRYPLGTRGYTRDGRVFRYARNGATALVAARPVQAIAPLAGAIGLHGGTTKTKANATRVTVISGATGVFTTVNAYADGYLFSYSSSTGKGGGLYAQIKSHTTQTATATGKVVVDLYSGEGLYSPSTIVGTTAIKLGLVHNPYNKVIVKPSGSLTAPIVGVTIRPVSANYYFWIQTWGPACIRADSLAFKVAQAVGASTNTSARVTGFNSTKPSSGAASITWTQVMYLIDQIGTAMIVGVSGESRMVNLKLAP